MIQTMTNKFLIAINVMQIAKNVQIAKKFHVLYVMQSKKFLNILLD